MQQSGKLIDIFLPLSIHNSKKQAMKKLLVILSFLFAGLLISHAQAPAAKQATTKKADVQQAPKNTTPANGVVLKKDGTPDKRYKNAPKGPLKKDGTPDMRYKDNKPATPKK